MARAGERAGPVLKRDGSGWENRRGLWRHRDFLLLWSPQGVSAVGSRVTRTALPMAAILPTSADPYQRGMLAVALSLPGVVVAWSAGGWVDRHRRRPLLIATDLIRAAVLLGIPVAATWKVATGLLTPTGALLGAALAATIGMRPTLVLLAVGFGVGACVLIVAWRVLPDDLRDATTRLATSS